MFTKTRTNYPIIQRVIVARLQWIKYVIEKTHYLWIMSDALLSKQNDPGEKKNRFESCALQFTTFFKSYYVLWNLFLALKEIFNFSPTLEDDDSRKRRRKKERSSIFFRKKKDKSVKPPPNVFYDGLQYHQHHHHHPGHGSGYIRLLILSKLKRCLGKISFFPLDCRMNFWEHFIVPLKYLQYSSTNGFCFKFIS